VGAVLLEEVIGEERNVLLPSPQRREVDGEDVESVIEVFAKEAGLDALAQVDAGGGDDAHVDRACLGIARAQGDAIGEDAQEAELARERQGAEIVEEQRAARG
jgi:hypothetical protein